MNKTVEESLKSARMVFDIFMAKELPDFTLKRIDEWLAMSDDQRKKQWKKFWHSISERVRNYTGCVSKFLQENPYIPNESLDEKSKQFMVCNMGAYVAFEFWLQYEVETFLKRMGIDYGKNCA